jgi:hypothetical protein
MGRRRSESLAQVFLQLPWWVGLMVAAVVYFLFTIVAPALVPQPHLYAPMLAEASLSFQSKFGPEEWLRPYTVEEVARLAGAGKRDIAVVAPAFSSDCVETLEEIREEIQHAFRAAGGERFTYIPCLNDDDAHIAMMAGIVRRELSGWI